MGIQDQFKDKAQQLAEQGKQHMGNPKEAGSPQRSPQQRAQKQHAQPGRTQQRSPQPQRSQQPGSKQRETNDESRRLQQEADDRFDQDYDA
ncbi:hypothetical protein [Streptomyces sp. NPDC059909]|uniref:hypothetical protein n=1 Tax=Streptomyces sp. NPDC059909 TaxID=3346998 RepID=UPI00366905DD